MNLMLPEGDMPVAWRGPVVTGAIKQFWQEVNWGDVDYMFVDMPPGTSDVFLTVFQSLPVDGIVTVSAPQELVAMIVGKAVNLAEVAGGAGGGPRGEHGLLQVRRVRQGAPHLRRAPGRGRGREATTSPPWPRCRWTRPSLAWWTRARLRPTRWKAPWTASSTRSSPHAEAE